MQKIKEILNNILYTESSEEYEKYLNKEEVIDTAKKIYDAVDSLNKMSNDEGIASIIIAKKMLENKK